MHRGVDNAGELILGLFVLGPVAPLLKTSRKQLKTTAKSGDPKQLCDQGKENIVLKKNNNIGLKRGKKLEDQYHHHQ